MTSDPYDDYYAQNVHHYDTVQVSFARNNDNDYEDYTPPRPKRASQLNEIDSNDYLESPSPPQQSRKFSFSNETREQLHFDVRTSSGGVIAFFDEDNRAQYKAVVDPSEQKIYINDKFNEAYVTVSKAMISLHPRFKIYYRGRNVGKATQRFKPAKLKKFNYKELDGGNVFKISGEEMAQFVMKKNESYEVASLEVMARGTYSVEINAVEEDIPHIIALLVICMAG
jgi:uncharacterized protein YxjI